MWLVERQVWRLLADRSAGGHRVIESPRRSEVPARLPGSDGNEEARHRGGPTRLRWLKVDPVSETARRNYFQQTVESSWRCRPSRVRCGFMGHNKGKDNVKKRAVRRKKTERLALAKSLAAAK